MTRRVLIMGAAGRDFHNFNTVYRDDADTEVVAFTATQIPFINDRTYPAELAGPNYPGGIQIHDESELTDLITTLEVDDVVFAYSDVSHEYVMHKGSEAMAAGANFLILGPDATMLDADVPVVSVCAVRTGSGKSQTTRAIAGTLKDAGKRVVAVRHPMPYGDLNAQRVQRYATVEDLDRYETTIEEREEYEPHISSGTIIYAGVDYADILAQAQQECDVLLWDGGNNDLPFYRPTVGVVVADPLRAGHETTYFPGETNIRMADVIVINKMDSATPEQLAALDATIRSINPEAAVVRANSRVTVDDPDAISGKRVLVIEDGPTLTHGEMKYGAGVVAARQHGAAEVVDPRRWAIGTIDETFRKYDVGPVLPAMGYSDGQLAEMEKIIDAADVDLVVIGTPIDLRRVITISKPAVRVRYDLEVLPGSPTLTDVLAPVLGGLIDHPREEAIEMERVVIALGGNALLRRGAEDTFEEMYRASRAAAERIADIAAAGWEVVVTHGNGPQVGRILLQQEAAKDVVHPMPLDVCGAESQGQIGYLLQVTIGDVFFERGMERPVATILTLTRVRPQDPAFRNPTKFVGPFYEEAEAKRLEQERGYVMKADPHGGWRRVVPSPNPYSIVETPVIERLVSDGTIVIASGGGGIPVIEKGPRLIGKEGVVDKDLAAAILAHEVAAPVLLILTDVKRVQRGFGSLYPEDIERMTVSEAKAMIKKGEFGAGSMGPKVQAACNFVENGGARAIIADLDDASAALEGEAGTVVTVG